MQTKKIKIFLLVFLAFLVSFSWPKISHASTSIPIHRFWSYTNQSHFYTASEEEKSLVIANYPENVWKYEGVAYNAFGDTGSEIVPVYRFWSDENQHHFYTASEDEKNLVIATYPERV